MKFFLSFLFISSSFLQAFPINFYRNQGELKYDELVNDHFKFYHDTDTPHEGVLLFNSLETAVPKLSAWFAVDAKDSMLAISSSETSHASFANFFFNTIELQTLGSGGRDLAWHELTHMFMYKKFDYPFLHFFLGYSTPVLHLFWMPVWFIEGLAELTSRSSGSSKMASVERYQALSGDWPSYDSLHSLYDGNGFAERGYATAGAFLTWMLLKKNENFIPTLLDNIKKYSMPWYYIWRLNPFSSFLPLDHSLELVFKKRGRNLYEDYKKEARDHWLSQDYGHFFSDEKTSKFSLSVHRPVFVSGKLGYILVETNSKIRHHKLVFDPVTGWLVGLKPYGPQYQNWFDANSIVSSSDKTFVVEYDRDFKYGTTTHKLVRLSDQKKMNYLEKEKVIYKPKGFVNGMYQSQKNILWHESEKESTRLCMMNQKYFFETNEIKDGNKNCFLEKKFPEMITLLGQEKLRSSEKNDEVKAIFYKEEKEKLKGKSEEIFRFDLDSEVTTRLSYPYGGSVKKIEPYQKGYLLLVETLSRQIFVHMKEEGECLGQYEIQDYLLDFNVFLEESLILSIYKGKYKSLRKVALSDLKKSECSYFKDHDSPLLYAERQEGKVPSLEESLRESSYWANDRLDVDSFKRKEEKIAQKEDEIDLKIFKNKSSIRHARFRARSIFYLPIFLNPNDITELGIGIFTIPFMDHLQNHQVWANAFWDFKNVPSFSLEYRLTRFWPTISFELYRREFWNGFEIQTATNPNDKDKILLSFVSEIGGLFSINFTWYTKKTTTSLTSGLKAAFIKDLTRLSTTDKTIVGGLYRPSLSLSHLINFDQFSLAFGGRFAYTLPVFESKFNYYTLGGDITANKPLSLLDSTLIFSLSGDITRGEAGKIPLLRQYYTALKTSIPLGALEFSDSNFYLFGSRRLFQLRYGDDKARVSLKWKVPIISQVDKLLWVFFLKQLNFTTLFNYGGIWNKGEFDFKKLGLSHAYNLDLHFGNKGVDLYSGVGVGQYVAMDTGKPEASLPALYFRFGFQALF